MASSKRFRSWCASFAGGAAEDCASAGAGGLMGISQVSGIEFSLIEKDVLYGLKQGNAVLKEIHKEMDLESVEKLMSDTAEGIAYQNVRPRCVSLFAGLCV